MNTYGNLRENLKGGRGGKGTPEYFGLEGEIDIINSTLGKALGGGTGGYTSASQEVVDVLRQRGRPYLFSNSIAPAVVGASLEVFRMLGENQDLITNLMKKFAGNCKFIIYCK